MSSDISVVIPTLGGPSLESTIAALNNGTVVPAEIVLCVPEREAATLRQFTDANVRVLATATSGQVSQRAEGFRLRRETERPPVSRHWLGVTPP